jgi:hypothetical protein
VWVIHITQPSARHFDLDAIAYNAKEHPEFVSICCYITPGMTKSKDEKIVCHSLPRECKSYMLQRDGTNLGSIKPVAFLKDMLDHAAENAEEDTWLFYLNADCYMTDYKLFQSEECDYIEFFRVNISDKKEIGELNAGSREISGIDGFAIRVRAWEKIKDSMPDVIIGHPYWDAIVSGICKFKLKNIRQYTDVVYHITHKKEWDLRELKIIGRWNRDLLEACFLGNSLISAACEIYHPHVLVHLALCQIDADWFFEHVFSPSVQVNQMVVSNALVVDKVPCKIENVPLRVAVMKVKFTGHAFIKNFVKSYYGDSKKVILVEYLESNPQGLSSNNIKQAFCQDNPNIYAVQGVRLRYL